MFNTILDKVTSYFNQHALITSFFPSLIFWALSSVLFILFQWRWQDAIVAWDAFSGTFQFLLIFAFFIWVAFWSFLTANARSSITRLFEGYWPNRQPFSRFYTWKRRRWQQSWNNLNEQDAELEKQESLLLSEQLAYEKLREALEGNQIAFSLPGKGTEQIGQELDAFLKQLEAQQQLPNNFESPSLSEIQEFGEKTRSWWQRVGPQQTGGQQPGNPWIQRYQRLEKCTARLIQEIEGQRAEVQLQRQALYRDISLYFPSEKSSIMPTRLGNILKATEIYSWKRYRLDAVIIWSRLEANLPTPFSNTLQNTKISFDLMITLAAFILAFGIPLALWTVIHTTMMLPWWFPLVLALIALVFRLYIVGIAAGMATLIWLVVIFLIPLPIPLAQLQMGLILFVSITLLFWLCYQNAIQAALAYGEQIKSAFDLYRWKVLEALHLQLPKDFEEERKVWEAVDGFLLRNYRPDPRYYRYAQSEKAENEKNTVSSSESS